MDSKIRENCQRHFKTHKATLIQDTDRYLAIDWRRSDGSGEYYVNYILDKKRGSLVVSGDLGNCIAIWYNTLDVTKLKSFINDIGYFIKKFQCSTDKYVYDEKDIIADIREMIKGKQIDLNEFVENNDDWYNDVDEFWRTVEDEIYESRCGDTFMPTEHLVEIFSKIDADYYEWLYSCGRRIAPRVYLWAVGFQMACDQLGL